MTYTEYSGARMRYRAEQKARRKRHTITAFRKISGAACFIFFLLVLGKAGASDCGAAFEEIFPSTLYFMKTLHRSGSLEKLINFTAKTKDAKIYYNNVLVWVQNP